MKYDFITIVKLIAATLLPVLLSCLVYFAQKKTKFGKLKEILQQIIIGVLFGGIAILGTEFGIQVEGAILNVRNAAPLVSGLLFGGPSGMIAGLIGGLYRFVATYWGAGEFSQIACSVSCLLAGFFAAGCRKFLFDGKKPFWIHGLFIGGTTEVLHMLLVFLFRMEDVYGAYKAVAACAIPMILCNAVSVMLSLLVLNLIGKKKTKKTKEDKILAKKYFEKKQINQVFQFFLMICVIVAFSATLIFTSSLQTKIAYANADSLLALNLHDVQNEIQDKNNTDEIKNIIVNRHIGKNGGIIACDLEGKILYDNGGHVGESVLVSKDANVDGVSLRFTANIGETESFCMYFKKDGCYFVAHIPVEEAMFSRNIAVTILAFMEVIVLSALFVHIYLLVKRQIVDNIHKINSSLKAITDGNLDVEIDVRKNAEFSSLSDDINATVRTLKKYIKEAEGRMNQELEFARQIQQSSLPSSKSFSQRSDISVFALMDAAKEVGGDFYDFWAVDSSHFAFLIADVSGKGIPGALFMMRAKAVIKNLAESGLDIDETFTRANRELCVNNDAEMFVTAWMGILDTETGNLKYVNAGHNPPLVRHGQKKFECLPGKPNFILAGLETTKYKKQETNLQKGDMIFLYTDGVTEASNRSNEFYGERRLKNVLSASADDPKEACKKVRMDINEFVKGSEQSDDITMLAIRINPEKRRNSKKMISEKSSVQIAMDFLTATWNEWKLPQTTLNKASIAVDEICSNIVTYSGASQIELEIEETEEGVLLVFADDGKPYDPTTAKEPDVHLSLEEREIGGLGIFMVRKLAAEIRYHFRENKNRLTVVFRE